MSVTLNCITNTDGSLTCNDVGSSGTSSGSNAAGGVVMDDGDAAWMLTSTAIVYMMTPGVGFFYGGMVGNKNIINTIFMSIICMGIVTVQWNLVGYAWAFGYGNKLWGNFDWAALNFQPNINDPDGFYAAHYPLSIHSAFQCAFAVITPALISGSIIGRMKFIPYCLFIFLWSCTAYDALACWVWNVNGWLHDLGAIDFAGGTVVHISSATAGLTACLILGARQEWKHGHVSRAPNVPFVVLGASLLWVGWMGFNAGSATAANSLAGTALVNTNGAAASAMLMWVALDALRGTVSVAGACSGIVVGLVAITPACGFIAPGWGILLGMIATLVVYYSQILWRRVMHVDDTLDVFTCHGMGGITGALFTGLFASAEWNGVNGSFYGNGIQICYQIAAIVTTLAWSSTCTAVILGFLHLVTPGGLRPSPEEEAAGLDKTAHGEEWEIAMQGQFLIEQLQQKDKNINGLDHKLKDGKLAMHFIPNDETDKSVHVEMQVPQRSPTPHEALAAAFERTSSSSQMNGNEYHKAPNGTETIVKNNEH